MDSHFAAVEGARSHRIAYQYVPIDLYIGGSCHSNPSISPTRHSLATSVVYDPVISNDYAVTNLMKDSMTSIVMNVILLVYRINVVDVGP